MTIAASPPDSANPDAVFAELRLLRSGDPLRAYDRARAAHERWPADWRFAHAAVLALARAGATRKAAEMFGALGLDAHRDELDVAALRARLLKDRGLAARGAARATLLGEAAGLYAEAAAAARRHGRPDIYYPAINAATLSLLVDRTVEARRFAQEALDALPPDGPRDYWEAATRLEAHLVRGEDSAAAALVPHLAAHRDWSERASTLRHLRLVCAARGTTPDWLARLDPPRVLVFGAAPLGDTDLDRVGFAYGSLCSRTAIADAERLVAAGAELHLVLPFPPDAVRRHCIAPEGESWAARFDAVLAGPAGGQAILAGGPAVTVATDEPIGGDRCAFGYASEMAAGLARLHASGIGAAIVDRGAAAMRPADDPGCTRTVRAMLTADLVHYSRFRDAEADRLVTAVLGALAGALAPFESAIGIRNTWGDAIFLVLDDVAVAADCALALLDAAASVERAGHGLSQPVGIRIGIHLGPVLVAEDPILRRPNVYGTHASRAARIEPVTPSNCAYLTEAAAAALALRDTGRFTLDYCGQLSAAKDAGPMRMFMLGRDDQRS